MTLQRPEPLTRRQQEQVDVAATWLLMAMNEGNTPGLNPVLGCGEFQTSNGKYEVSIRCVSMEEHGEPEPSGPAVMDRSTRWLKHWHEILLRCEKSWGTPEHYEPSMGMMRVVIQDILDHLIQEAGL